MGHEPVVRRIVEAAEAHGGAELIAFAGVVVDDVEDHFDAGPVKGLHHRLELDHLFAHEARGERRIGCEKADRVVAPVVREPELLQTPLAHRLMDGQELDGGDAQRAQVIQDGIGHHAQVSAAQIAGHFRVQLGHALHVAFVDERAAPGDVRRAIITPGERVLDDQALGHDAGAVALVEAEVDVGVADLVAEHFVRRVHGASDGFRVRIDQQLVRVEAAPLLRRVRPGHAVAIQLAWAHVRQIAVPNAVRAHRERDANRLLRGAWRIEQAQFDSGGLAREDREVDAFAVPGGAEWVRRAGPCSHASAVLRDQESLETLKTCPTRSVGSRRT